MTADENKIREQRIQAFVDELEEILREVHAFNYGFMFHKAIDLECGLHYDVKDLPCDPFKVMTFEELEKVYIYIDTVYEHLRQIQKAGRNDDYVS